MTAGIIEGDSNPFTKIPVQTRFFRQPFSYLLFARKRIRKTEILPGEVVLGFTIFIMMNLASISIVWLLIFLFFINIIAIVIIKGADRFWLPCILIWVFLLSAYIFVRVVDNTAVEREEARFNRTTSTTQNETDTTFLQGDNWYELEQVKQKEQQHITLFLRLLGFQSFFTFFAQLIGFQVTRQPFYRSTALAFFILVIVYLFIEFRDVF